MIDVIIAGSVLGGLGIFFGIILAIAAKVFSVEKDEREEAICGILPGANCGGCGFPGCSGYAAAVVAGKAPLTACAAGGPEVVEQMSAIMGIEAGAMERSVAFLKCAGTTDRMKKKFVYIGMTDCLSATRLGGGSGPNGCPHGCLGFGSCIKTCAFGAMSMKDGIVHIDHERCKGCMACADSCPKKLIVKVPYSAKTLVTCATKDKGAAVRKYCEIGCIGCNLCVKNCPNEAVKMVDNVAVIDYSKCDNCGICVAKCSRKTISGVPANLPDEKKQA